MSPQNTQLATEETQENEPTSGKNGVQRRTNVRWKLFILLLVLVAVNYIDRGSISVALPIIQKEFNLPPELVGLLLSAFFWTYALMQIPVGWLIDKFGPPQNGHRLLHRLGRGHGRFRFRWRIRQHVHRPPGYRRH